MFKTLHVRYPYRTLICKCVSNFSIFFHVHIGSKVYNVENKIPKLLQALSKPFMGGCSYEFHEEAWNSFPYCKTVLTKPGTVYKLRQ